MDDDEMLYRQMNEEDPYYMGDEEDTDDEEWAEPATESEYEEGGHSTNKGNHTPQNAGCFVALLTILSPVLAIVVAYVISG